MGLFFELVIKFLGKVFNDPTVPWYENVLLFLTTIIFLVLVIYLIRKVIKK